MPTVNGFIYRLNDMKVRSAFAARGVAGFVQLKLKSNSRPSIAAVMVGRNDDYMSDFAQRLEATISWNLRYLVDEIVFVEWNPPADRDLLSYELAKKFDCLRAYVVPRETHDRICRNEHINLLEYHAKNVGIRRAKAPWIMATNADAALGFDAVNTLRDAQLEGKTIWTGERFDIHWSEGQQDRIRLTDTLRYLRVIPYRELGTGEFCLASRDLWHEIRGYDEKMVRHRMGCDVRGVAQMVVHGAKIKRVGTVLHLMHPTTCTEVILPNQGERATAEGVPYQNDEDWGLGNSREEQLAERVWRLE